MLGVQGGGGVISEETYTDRLGEEAAVRDRAIEEGLDPDDDDFDVDEYLNDLHEDHFEPPEPDDRGYGPLDTWGGYS